ncbi:pirin family protein [Anaerotalea alkaliphila]|uniref:Pirin family protein n=1 Tax=Anaerotalea alkaliphila TaxID=2662126 RepID=A0A7X5HY36_9FIRM|nr:pirin family protein [Anaerotalea alkaliphila]NDL68795.1 pirin family protein [Anaerotalea alkaliphila]
MRKKLLKAISAKSTTDGAGVPLNRVFGYYEIPEFDPFLMLDYFRLEDAAAARMGFPWHPHRGIETITYMLEGQVRHEDSIGNSGTIGKDQIQWMTAGRGIFHQEMPQAVPGGMEGFQLWLNLPAKDKMCEPRYEDIDSSRMVHVEEEEGVRIALVGGSYKGFEGPVQKGELEVGLMDITVPKGVSFKIRLPEEVNTFVFVFRGLAKFDDSQTLVRRKQVALFGEGEYLEMQAVDPEEDLRVLLGYGKMLREPIAWGGPIVMNTKEELNRAFEELDKGTFVRGGH